LQTAGSESLGSGALWYERLLKLKVSLLSNYPNAAAIRGAGRITADAREKE
jgi:hypothetical protein